MKSLTIRAKFNTSTYLALTCATFGLSSCSSTPRSVNDPEYTQAKSQVAAFEQDLNQAKIDQVGVLSPQNFANAEGDLKDAKHEIDNQSDTKDILKPLEAGKSSLALAKSVADQDRPLVPELTTTRTDALNADAPHLASEKWQKAEDLFQNRMKGLEKDKSSNLSANDRKEIQERYIRAQTDALKVQYLGSLKEKVKTLENENGNKLVPNALNETKNKILSAEGAIDTNRNSTDIIQRAALSAQVSYDHTKALYDRAENVKAGSPEEVAGTLLQKDVRTQSLNHELNQTETTLAQTQTENRDLHSKAGVQAYITGLQNRFDPSEAEVYQQGSNVLIRLKGMQFKSGGAEIPAKSTALLEQVKQTIKEVPDSSVLIEGHTDAVGSANKNRELSQARADSIKEYLESDQAIKENRLFSKGYGFDQPLTSNKTASGRAQNRRVDILIENISGDKSAPSANE